MMLFAFLFFCNSIFAQPHCAEPRTRRPPKYTDCEQVIRLIEQKAMHTGDPLCTASRRYDADIRLPKSFNAAMFRNTCAVNLNMAEGREYSMDSLHLSDVAFVAQTILEECLTPRILAPATEGWMTTGRSGIINVTLQRSRPTFIRPSKTTDILEKDFDHKGRFCSSTTCD